MHGILCEGRGKRLAAVIIVILLGLTLRMVGHKFGLPFFVVKYGGSLLWGGMVYLLLATLMNARSTMQLILVSIAIAVCVEFFRLYHSPGLDEFRLTVAGALLLGRVFSLWNIVAYILGIVLAALVDHRILRR